jgi:hypothetical protein
MGFNLGVFEVHPTREQAHVTGSILPIFKTVLVCAVERRVRSAGGGTQQSVAIHTARKVSGAEFWISTLLQLVEETNCALIHGEPFQVFTILNPISVTNNVANDCHYDIWFLQAWVLLA